MRPTSSTRSEASSDDEGADSGSEDEQEDTEDKKDTTADRSVGVGPYVNPIHYRSSHSNPCVYRELGDGQVLGAIENHIKRYAAHSAKEHQDNPASLVPPPDFILFQQAMEHATRLSRAMVGFMPPFVGFCHRSLHIRFSLDVMPCFLESLAVAERACADL